MRMRRICVFVCVSCKHNGQAEGKQNNNGQDVSWPLSQLVTMVPLWILLVSPGFCWSSLFSTGLCKFLILVRTVCWFTLVFSVLSWSPLVSVLIVFCWSFFFSVLLFPGLYWCPPVPVGFYWSLFTEGALILPTCESQLQVQLE